MKAWHETSCHAANQIDTAGWWITLGGGQTCNHIYRMIHLRHYARRFYTFDIERTKTQRNVTFLCTCVRVHRHIYVHSEMCLNGNLCLVETCHSPEDAESWQSRLQVHVWNRTCLQERKSQHSAVPLKDLRQHTHTHTHTHTYAHNSSVHTSTVTTHISLIERNSGLSITTMFERWAKENVGSLNIRHHCNILVLLWEYWI